MLRTVADQPTLWEAILPDELRRLPTELARIDVMLDDPVFFAPFIPFAVEETWSWSHDGSVHVQPWPEQAALGGDPAVLSAASTVLTAIRRAKTDAKASQKTPARSAVVTAPAELVASLRLAAGDLAAVGRIAALDFAEGDALAVPAIPSEDVAYEDALAARPAAT